MRCAGVATRLSAQRATVAVEYAVARIQCGRTRRARGIHFEWADEDVRMRIRETISILRTVVREAPRTLHLTRPTGVRAYH